MAGEAEHVVQQVRVCIYLPSHTQTHTQLLCYSQVWLSSKLDCSQRRHPGATMRFNRSSPSNDARPSSTLVPHSTLHSKSNSSLISAFCCCCCCSFTTHLSQSIFPLLIQPPRTLSLPPPPTCQLGTGPLCRHPRQRGKRDEVQVKEKAKQKQGRMPGCQTKRR